VPLARDQGGAFFARGTPTAHLLASGAAEGARTIGSAQFVG
jgi:hypothetical protein